MKKLLLATALALLSAFAHAAPASAESIERLLTLTRMESMLDGMYANVDQLMRQAMRQRIGNRTLDADQQRLLDELTGKFVVVMRQEFNWATLKPHYMRIYQETFEQEEIDGLIAFYSSPAGQAFVSKMPTVMQKSMNLAQEQLRTLAPRMAEVIEQAMREAKVPRQ